MPQQRDEPRPHGDPLEHVVNANPEDNRAQRDSDAPPDAVVEQDEIGAGQDPGGRMNQSDRADGRGSDANGVPAFDEADGDLRRKQYKDGADLVSGID